MHAGALRAARDLDVDIVWKGPIKENDRSAQIQTVENFVVRGVDGIVLMPLDYKALAPPAEEAKRRGIPVVIADSDLDWDGRVSFVVALMDDEVDFTLTWDRFLLGAAIDTREDNHEVY